MIGLTDIVLLTILTASLFALGRTSLWWDNIRNGVALDDEWRQNFRMSKPSLEKLALELSPQLIRNNTNMRKSVDVLTQV